MLMCLWNRPERIGAVLEQLDRQDHPDGVRLYLWNNRRSDHGRYLQAIDAFRPAGSLHAVDIAKSPFNLGSIARFYWARRLQRRGRDAPVIVLDDDEQIPDDFVSIALAAYRPDEVAAFWAFRVLGDYFDRAPVAPGEEADHVGPGGMVCSLRLFSDLRFFTKIPARYWMLDDIWFTHFARHSGRRLVKLPVELEFVLEETNQHWGQSGEKIEFYRELQRASPLD
ncbi:hypothetical protein GCM10009840_14150 [Pseudolysinimonas kribbensis]